MPEIRIAFDLPSFKYSFVWTATEAEATRLLETQRAAVAKTGKDPSAVFNSMVAMAPTQLAEVTDPVAKRGIHVMVTAWALQISTQDPEHPGTVIEYLPAYDFDITIEKLERAPAGTGTSSIVATIEAKPRDAEVAGLA